MKHHKEAKDLIAQTEQNVAWQLDPGAALQIAITEVFKDASEDAQANLYTAIAAGDKVVFQGDGWDIETIQKLIEANI